MDFIGKVTVPAGELVDTSAPFPRVYTLENEKKKTKKGKTHEAGKLNLLYTQVEKIYTFIDYLQGGCEISLIVGIDFTGSNGDPATPGTLHYYDAVAAGGGGPMNGYMEAILSVGEILSCYDTDKLFPVFGFGGKLPDGSVSHCFPLNGSTATPSVFGVPGILQAYTHALSYVSLWGPTNFAPLINTVCDLVRSSQAPGKLSYSILLILTDGIITDMKDTKDALVRAADLPLSVVIVGIGNADFDAMDELDGDITPVRDSKGRTIARDIVQFVAFNKFKNRHYSFLSQEVLMEIPSIFI
jgi:hypothetical protein